MSCTWMIDTWVPRVFAIAHCASMYFANYMLAQWAFAETLGTHNLIAQGVVNKEKPENLGSRHPQVLAERD